jgi:tRNA U34 5-methylaminomethyl-2-thiouridine-forming methyltransferase MnmC
VSPADSYRLVKLAGGAYSVHSTLHRETFHPVIGPEAEAEALYVRQLRLAERMRASHGEFVVWDVGLGAAANALTVVRAARSWPGSLRLISFDQTLEPLRFALRHTAQLAYLQGWERTVEELIERHTAAFSLEGLSVRWELHLGDFPAAVQAWSEEPRQGRARSAPPAPHAILFDAYSPARNPAMWTEPLFAALQGLLDPRQPCALPTYSRSTMLRVTLLLAGFFVGTGHATGEKEETTMAANDAALVAEPLGLRWLQRARRSTSAEPLWEPVYRQARLSAASWERLRQHPQFAGQT